MTIIKLRFTCTDHVSNRVQHRCEHPNSDARGQVELAAGAI